MGKSKRFILLSILFFCGLFYCAQLGWAANPLAVKAAKGKKKSEAQAEVKPPEKLTGDQIDGFMATLSDQQVRRLLIEELRKKAEQEKATAQTGQYAERGSGLQQVFDEADAAASAIFTRIRRIFRESASVLSQPRALIALLSDDKGTASLLLTFVELIGLIGVGLLGVWLLVRLTEDYRNQLLSTVPLGSLEKLGRILLRLLLSALVLAAYVLITFVLFIVFYDKGSASYTIILTYVIVSYYLLAIIFLARILLSPASPTLRLVPMADEDAAFLYRWFLRITIVAAVIVGASAIVRNIVLSEELYLLLYSAAGLSVFLLLIVMIWQSRQRVAQAICQDAAEGTCDYSPLRAGFAKSWHILAIVYVILMGAFWQIGALIEGKGTILKLIGSLFLIPLFVGIDQWGERLMKVASGELPETFDLSGDERVEAGDDPESSGRHLTDHEPAWDEKEVTHHYIPLLKQLFRIVLALALLFLFLRLWDIDLSITRIFSSTLLSIIVAVLLGLFIWEYTKTLIDKKLEEEFSGDGEEIEEGGGAGGTRKGTLLMLLRKFVLTVLVVIVMMIVLAQIGVNIGPMIAGAGIAGLAIGFGAQTLVKDIISGVFFLVDDAFRVGDFVETAGMKGSVEKISLRSMRLRNARGPIITIPFGDMKTVTNFSRDYQIMKLDIRVRYDTNIKKVKKIIKKIDQKIQEDPELAAGLLDKIKSQGVKAMDDSAMIMRVKFKTVPGRQFIIRREVFQRIQEAFRKEGIQFAHRNVTVYMPPETTAGESKKETDSEDDSSTSTDKRKLEAAAAAALAIAAEEEEAAKEGEKEKDDR
ncbi:MAG: mechanosensitive ion channel family protein [Deltaproteobacteria bacterium]|nr:mechanosensitive ion channel family protein [Deltaproteobacteria bacterium]